MTYAPTFPHEHYHSYTVKDGKISAYNPVLLSRATEIAAVLNQIGARSVVDIGSNLGGFLFFLEMLGGRTDLLGIEADAKMVNDCTTVADIIGSKVKFLNTGVMNLGEPDVPADAIILQNIYHYLFDSVGDHLTIFKKLARLGRSIVWYNPMSADDPVIPKHANTNKQLDWAAYNRQSIFQAAIDAGFLHPIPLRLRYKGMGETREHWLFVLDRVKKLSPAVINASEMRGEKQAINPHYSDSHSVLIDHERSFKYFRVRNDPLAGLKKAIGLGILDKTMIERIEMIADEKGHERGYAQPRGLMIHEMNARFSPQIIQDEYRKQVWRLLSRLVRHRAFFADFGEHNFVFIPSRREPILIDLENFVFDDTLSLTIYDDHQSDYEIECISANWRNIFGRMIEIKGRRKQDLLWDALSNDFLRTINVVGLLDEFSRAE